MKDRVTQADIAKAAGVTVASVSLSLRNDPRISKELRERVANLARELGYRPDPMLSWLAASRNKSKIQRHQATLAWIDSWDQPSDFFATGHDFEDFHAGALSHAEALGFNLEWFRLKEKDMDEKRLCDILWSRGVAGLVIPPHPVVGGVLQLKWELFSEVTIGYSLGWPELHRTSNSQFVTGLLATLHLWRLGYRRIGFCSNPQTHFHLNLVDMGFLGGHLSGVEKLPDLEYVPAFRYVDPDMDLRAIKVSFNTWLKKNACDAVIAHGRLPYLQWIREAGLTPPADLGYAELSIDPKNPEISGVDQCSFGVGKTTIDLLVDLINKHERGIPKKPVSVLVDGVWFPGKTVRSLHGKPIEPMPDNIKQILAQVQPGRNG